MKEALLLGGALAAFAGIVLSETGGEDVPDIAVTPAQADREFDADTRAAAAHSADQHAQAITFGNTGITELQRSKDGHFYVQAQVNGRPTRFMIDTGATVIALTGRDAQALGLHWTYDDLAIVAQGASGPVQGVHKRLDRVSLDRHEVRGLDAIVVPEGLAISLLGQSFLSTIASVRIEGDRMILSDRPLP